MLPVGLPAPGATTLTLAVNVTEAPNVDVLLVELEVNAVVVTAGLTVSPECPLLARWTSVRTKFAVMVCVPVPTWVGVIVTVQREFPFVAVAASVHVPVI